MSDLTNFFEEIKSIDLLLDAENLLLKYFDVFCYGNLSSKEKISISKKFDKYLEELSFVLANNNLADKILSSLILLSYIASALKELNKILKENETPQYLEFNYVEVVSEFESSLSLSFDIIKSFPEQKRIGVMPFVAYKANMNLLKSCFLLLQSIKQGIKPNKSNNQLVDNISQELGALSTVIIEYQQAKYSDTKEIVENLGI